MKKQLVISGFPGTGKSYYVNNNLLNELTSDSDSSKFDKANFPQNYIEHIKELIEKGTVRIFVSSHKEVREALVKEGINFILAYPKRELKEEYIERYKQRGNNESFIKLVSENWDSWITELENQEGCEHKQLCSGQFVADVI
ncbi:MAG: hypothetical protein ACRCX2_09750 [Paraclostridium sp.]